MTKAEKDLIEILAKYTGKDGQAAKDINTNNASNEQKKGSSI